MKDRWIPQSAPRVSVSGRGSVLEARGSVLEARGSMLEARGSVLEARESVLAVGGQCCRPGPYRW